MFYFVLCLSSNGPATLLYKTSIIIRSDPMVNGGGGKMWLCKMWVGITWLNSHGDLDLRVQDRALCLILRPEAVESP